MGKLHRKLMHSRILPEHPNDNKYIVSKRQDYLADSVMILSTVTTESLPQPLLVATLTEVQYHFVQSVLK